MQLNIPQRLKDLRESHGYSQEKIANFLGMRPGTYQHYEAGRACPSIETFLLLCELYNFSTINELLGLLDASGLPIERKEPQNAIVFAYHSIDPEKRKIVDFILNLNC